MPSLMWITMALWVNGRPFVYFFLYFSHCISFGLYCVLLDSALFGQYEQCAYEGLSDCHQSWGCLCVCVCVWGKRIKLPMVHVAQHLINVSKCFELNVRSPHELHASIKLYTNTRKRPNKYNTVKYT